MSFKNLGLLVAFMVTTTIFGQNKYAITNIPAPLFENANSVLRSEEIKVTVEGINKVVVEQLRAVTVLNKYGDSHAMAMDFYDKSTRIKDQRLTIYDALGNEIREYKERDFKDQSAVSGVNLYTDNRVSF